MSLLQVRDSKDDDLSAIAEIYGREVLHGLATFEEEPPSAGEIGSRRSGILEAGLPYLVADAGSSVAGFAYANMFRPRPAYRNSVENSVYVDPGWRGQGVGRALLSALIERCEAGPWRQMIAVIGDSENAGSIGLHTSLGFRQVGVIQSVGFKLGRWVDTVMMQRALGQGDKTPPTG